MVQIVLSFSGCLLLKQIKKNVSYDIADNNE